MCVCACNYLSSVHKRLGPIIIYSKYLQEGVWLAEEILRRENTHVRHCLRSAFDHHKSFINQQNYYFTLFFSLSSLFLAPHPFPVFSNLSVPPLLSSTFPLRHNLFGLVIHGCVYVRRLKINIVIYVCGEVGKIGEVYGGEGTLPTYLGRPPLMPQSTSAYCVWVASSNKLISLNINSFYI